jgi:hypothetical protein
MKPGRNIFILLVPIFFSCSKAGNGTSAPVHENFICRSVTVNGVSSSANNFTNITLIPRIRLAFSTSVSRTSASSVISFSNASGITIPVSASFENNDSVLVLQPTQALSGISAYTILVPVSLTSPSGGHLTNAIALMFTTAIDSTYKFPRIADTALLTLVQRQTFRYFWDFGHPVSGLARERNNYGETVTSGGSGFGIMAILAGIHRNFITHAQGLARIQTITDFLKNTAKTFHGAYPHWLNGSTGAVIPFSAKDDGADLVETSYLVQGLLCARQFFDGADAAETALRNDINTIWNGVEWDWFRQNNQDVLYWHWSPSNGWAINLPIRGWNECLITYVLAAASGTHGIPRTVYDKGWASGGGIVNGTAYYGYPLPLGPATGGPLFFDHYSFLGINPNGLSDSYADYSTQTKNHALINYSYCKANPKAFYGYSDSCWGLTASDIRNGYTASSPTNDVGVIAPTAAIASLPYTPAESMKALKFFYYVLGDKLWKDYGFIDAFSLQDAFLAIDQGPQVVMIENYRSGLLWNLFTSCPEIKSGMKTLGFSAPYL